MNDDIKIQSVLNLTPQRTR